MDDRFDRTQRQAEAAIDRAKVRQSVAHDRRRALEERIAELAKPAPPHRVYDERANLAEARERVEKAQASSELAQQRAEEAESRRDPPQPS